MCYCCQRYSVEKMVPFLGVLYSLVIYFVLFLERQALTLENSFLGKSHFYFFTSSSFRNKAYLCHYLNPPLLFL